LARSRRFYAVRPPRVRREKPRVSAFTSADTAKIVALAPDLVLAFSDLQAGIVQDLARAGLAVHLFNQRDVAGILAMVRTLGALIDRRDAADTLADSLARRLEAIAREQQHRSPRPRVFFEEWDEPLIAGIGWVSELIEIAGGSDVCRDLRAGAAAKDRIVTPDAIAATRPDVPFFGAFGAAWDIVASWSANPLGMLWPEMNASLIASGGGRVPPATPRRQVISPAVSAQPAVPTAGRAEPGRESSHSR
jgi:ABC-type Fe3+-hydroxamate transport system substrate-binding protein